MAKFPTSHFVGFLILLQIIANYTLLSDIPWNIPRVTCIAQCTHEPLGKWVYQENTSDKRDIPWHITRERYITILYHGIENT